MRVLLPEDYTFPAPAGSNPFARGEWPASWVGFPGGKLEPAVYGYRLRVTLPAAARVRIHVTADQRYELFLDGKRVGRGSERGDRANWFYETYELSVPAGEHVLAARVWWLGTESGYAPAAQVTNRPAFLVCAEAPHTDLFSTGRANWEAKRLGGYTFIRSPFPGAGWFAGGTVEVDGDAFPLGWAQDRGSAGWEKPPRIGAAAERVTRWGEMDAPRLRPATLPDRLEEPRRLGVVRHLDAPESADTSKLLVEPSAHRREEAASWQALLRDGTPLTIPPQTRRRLIIDLLDYYCAYPDVTLSGGRGATVRLHWAEGLYEPRGGGDRREESKGNRDVIAGKRFLGRGDTFRPGGGGEPRTFDTLWWSCGRYLELYVETGAEPLTLYGPVLRETRYPLEREGKLSLSDMRFDAVQPIMWRTLQMCSHETYMDCPYYEQLQYTGDTRLEALVTYVNSHDHRLPRKAVRMFGASQTFAGLTQARYPARSEQIIPQFSLFWIALLHDYALWNDDPKFVRRHLPRARGVTEVFLEHVREDGLLRLPEGWDWVDWVRDWPNGQPPRDMSGISGINQWQLIMVMGHAAALERAYGEAVLAERLEKRRRELAQAAAETFWSPERKLFADTPSKNSFSEHAQCYALLSGVLEGERRDRLAEALLHPDKNRDLAPATIYFLYYVFEALRSVGRADAMLDRMGLWHSLPELGLKTALESPEPSRSDCHAWSAHPLYHGAASLVGVRPREFGFKSVEIAPQLGALERASATVCHPGGGTIRAALERKDGSLHAEIALPENVPGTFRYAGEKVELAPGAARTLAIREKGN
jgi:alpha-L-rhamnosidase